MSIDANVVACSNIDTGAMAQKVVSNRLFAEPPHICTVGSLLKGEVDLKP